jgi:hypothetical protein
MELLLRPIFNKLTVISDVPAGGRLCIIDDKYDVVSDSYEDRIKRFYYHSNRDSVITHLTALYRDIKYVTETVPIEPSLLCKFRGNIVGSSEGLENLKSTYSSDRNTAGRLQNILDDIESIISLIDRKLSHPQQYSTDCWKCSKKIVLSESPEQQPRFMADEIPVTKMSPRTTSETEEHNMWSDFQEGTMEKGGIIDKTDREVSGDAGGEIRGDAGGEISGEISGEIRGEIRGEGGFEIESTPIEIAGGKGGIKSSGQRLANFVAGSQDFASHSPNFNSKQKSTKTNKTKGRKT